jgi:ABC-type multidrug transport system fused ATPase/permease subunit
MEPKNIVELPTQVLRKSMAVVSQKTLLFGGKSIEENIEYGRNHCDTCYKNIGKKYLI